MRKQISQPAPLGCAAFAGARYAYLRRSLFVTYFGDSHAKTGESIEMGTRFQGFGLRGGAAGSLALGLGASLSAEMAVSILAGTREATVSTGLTAFGDASARATDRAQKLIPVFEGGVGLGLERNLGDKFSLSVDLGYRLENWFGLVELISREGNGSRSEISSDLGLHGLFLRASARF